MNRRIDVNMTPFELIDRQLVPLSKNQFYELSVNYGIDPSFALATWAWETGWGTSELWQLHNNPAGITCGYEYCSYESQEQGLQAMFQLMRYYINELGRNTVTSVRELWSESEDAEMIYAIMEEIHE